MSSTRRINSLLEKAVQPVQESPRLSPRLRTKILAHRKTRQALIVGLVIFTVATLVLVAQGFRDDVAPSDIALVLGSKVERDGQPSRGLRARLDEAVNVYHSGAAPLILVSGGLGKEGYDEAAVMGTYLVAQGIPQDHILLDGHGDTTYESARNLCRIMKERHLQSAIVVSQYFHIPRARLAVRRFGIAPVRSAHAHCFEWRDLYSAPRECVAIVFYALRSYG